jgi:hypothetical protein
MASILGFSEFNNNTESNNNKSNNRRRNKTIKKKEKKTPKVQNLLNSIEEFSSIEDGKEDNLANFNPPQNPILSKQPENVKESQIDSNITVESYNNLDNLSAQQEYYKNYVPYFTQPANNANLHGTKDDLMLKLNYMIQLLEESKEEKTENVTEELVLYMFLGVFVIFIVDSFARAGKYTR